MGGGTLKLAVSSVRGMVSEGEVVKRREDRSLGSARRGIYLSDRASMRLALALGVAGHLITDGRMTINDAPVFTRTGAKPARRETRDRQIGPYRRARGCCQFGGGGTCRGSCFAPSVAGLCWSLSISSSFLLSRRLCLLPRVLPLSLSLWHTRCPRRALCRTPSTSPPS